MWTGKSKEKRRVDKQSKTERRRATETQSPSARQFSSLAAPKISISTTVVHESIQQNTYTRPTRIHTQPIGKDITFYMNRHSHPHCVYTPALPIIEKREDTQELRYRDARDRWTQSERQTKQKKLKSERVECDRSRARVTDARPSDGRCGAWPVRAVSAT